MINKLVEHLSRLIPNSEQPLGSGPMLSLAGKPIRSPRDVIVDVLCILLGLSQGVAAVEAWDPEVYSTTLFEAALVLLQSVAHMVGVAVMSATVLHYVLKGLDRRRDTDSQA